MLVFCHVQRKTQTWTQPGPKNSNFILVLNVRMHLIGHRAITFQSQGKVRSMVFWNWSIDDGTRTVCKLPYGVYDNRCTTVVLQSTHFLLCSSNFVLISEILRWRRKGQGKICDGAGSIPKNRCLQKLFEKASRKEEKESVSCSRVLIYW